MKILLIGATGNIGQRILKEALDKGYEVTSAQRHPEVLEIKHPQLTVIKGDLLNETELPSLLSGHDLIISAISAHGESTWKQFKKANDNLIAALQEYPNKRLIIVGSAGNLEIAPGLRVLYSGIMHLLPEEWNPDIFAHAYVLDRYKASEVYWTYFSPAKETEPGERSCKYRLGNGDMIIDDKRNSKISIEDYAAALVDEIENKRFVKQQMSIGY